MSLHQNSGFAPFTSSSQNVSSWMLSLESSVWLPDAFQQCPWAKHRTCNCSECLSVCSCITIICLQWVHAYRSCVYMFVFKPVQKITMVGQKIIFLRGNVKFVFSLSGSVASFLKISQDSALYIFLCKTVFWLMEDEWSYDWTVPVPHEEQNKQTLHLLHVSMFCVVWTFGFLISSSGHKRTASRPLPETRLQASTHCKVTELPKTLPGCSSVFWLLFFHNIFS